MNLETIAGYLIIPTALIFGYVVWRRLSEARDESAEPARLAPASFEPRIQAATLAPPHPATEFMTSWRRFSDHAAAEAMTRQVGNQASREMLASLSATIGGSLNPGLDPPTPPSGPPK